MKILVTGGSGAVGRQFIADLRSRAPDSELVVLSRQNREIPGCANLVCDLRLDDACSRSTLSDALADVDYIVHLAADVRWSQGFDDAIANNTETTRRLVEAAARNAPKLRRFVFVSTAFVACPDTGIRTEASIAADGRAFNNSYEASKWMAENVVRDSGLPFAIVRPSLVVGHSRSGHISRFNGFYRIMKLQAQGMMPIMVGDPAGYIDITPVDIVSEAIFYSLFAAHEGETIWATSGAGAPRFAQFLEEQTRALNEARESVGLAGSPQPPILPYEAYRLGHRPLLAQILSRHEQTMLRSVEFFIPYLSVPRPIARADADPSFASPPHEAYLGASMSYWCRLHKDLIARKPYVWNDMISRIGEQASRTAA